jgi:uncharacterized membrane-anchored protein
MHTFGHYGSIVALILTGFCGGGAIILLAAAISLWREKKQIKQIVWQVPTVAVVLTGFWLAVATALSHL